MLVGMTDSLIAKQCPIDLQYEQIYDDFWDKEAEAIQHQFVWQDLIAASAMKAVPLVKDFTIPLKPLCAARKADPRSIVYGYNDDGSLDLTGGSKKSYNQGFNKFQLRYHGALEAKYPSGDPENPVTTQTLSFLDADTVKNLFEENIPYFVQRGFDIQGDDVFKKFDHQYIWTWPAGQLQEFGLPGYVAMRLVWDDKHSSHKNKCSKNIPDFVDLHASINQTLAEYFVLDTYKHCSSEHKNGYGYPTRIPVTTKYCRFKENLNVKPIAFYDKGCHVLTIHVPNTDSAQHFLVRRNVNVNNPNLNVNYIEHLAGFNGSFKAFTRDKYGRLLPSDLKKADLFAQVSDVVTMRSRVSREGEVSFPDIAWPIRLPVLDDESEYYTGIVAPAMNGGSPAYDCYAVPIPDLNAYEIDLDPTDTPEQKVHGHHYHYGDNPRTKVVERYSALSSITLWDNEAWNLAGLKLPLDMLHGETSYPENVSTAPIPANASGAESFVLVNAHEFTHQAQNASGSLYFLPVEAMAVGVELDTHASGEVFIPLRAGTFTQRTIRTLRGEFTAMRPDAFGVSTYGMGMWWKYIQDQFDHNNQVMRRTMDILTNETVGQLMEANDFPDCFAVEPVNAVGGSSALNQALGELYGKNIKDVWNDYSVSLALLRNNTSIPAKWRNYLPYWIYNTEYSGFNKLNEAVSVFGLGQFSNWWENMQNNAVIPANYNTAYTGETFVRTLPEHFETDALSLKTYAFNVTQPSEGGPETIKVEVSKGEWRVTLVQFTSDGTRDGSFIADGPHTLVADGTDTITFDVANHSPAFSDSGNIRLICVNVTFDGTGNQLDEYFTPEVPNGHIKIDAPVAP